MLRAWNTTVVHPDATEAANATSAAAIARASTRFTAAWATAVTLYGQRAKLDGWNHPSCVSMGQDRVANERLFDEQKRAHAPHLFGWPELSLPTAVVWPAGLHERDLGSCAAAPGK